MKEQIVKIAYLALFIVFILNAQIYAADRYAISISEHSEGATSSGSSTCSSKQKYYQGMTLENVKVKFTQDDEEYYFNITANSSFKFWGNKLLSTSLCQANYYDIPQPVLYKIENFGDEMVVEESSKVGFIDYHGTIYTKGSVTIKNTEIAYYDSSADVSSSTINSSDYTERNNGDKFFIPNEARIDALANTYNYKNVKEYPRHINNREGVRVINNASSKSFTIKEYDYDGNGNKDYIDNANVTINIKLAIEKSYIDDYRYVCFICSEMGYEYVWQKNDNYLSHGYSISTNTIDLKDFVTCNHNWSVTKSDAVNHVINCAKCEWEKTEVHDYKFEYDGIVNDVCICSRVKQVKYHYDINDDFNVNVDKILNTNSICEKVEFKKKTGYNFKWYEKYELQFDGSNLFNLTTDTINATKVFLNNTTSIDSTTGSRSIFYKAVYSPIKYVFNYSNKASTKDYISKRLNKSISPQTFYYNSKDYLKDHSEYDYLKFIGWTLTEGSELVDFSSKAEIFNYTSVDLSEFTLYPIYEPLEYKILYNTISGKYEGDTQQVSKSYDYYINEDFLKPKEMGKNKAFSHYVDMYGNEFTDMNALRNFIKDGAGDGQTIILFAMSKTIEGSTDDESASSTPQNYWDLNNRDNPKDDTGGGSDIDDGKDISESSDTKTSNDNSNNTDINNINTNLDSSDSSNSNTSTNTSKSDSNEVNTNSDSSNNKPNSSSTISYKYYPSSDGGGGGSNNRPERIKSFPEDKYTGPGVVNSLNDAVSAEAKINNSLDTSLQYLYNNKLKQEDFNVKKLSKDDKKATLNNDAVKKELEDEVFGPPFIDFEMETNYRGPHGPWHYEKKYIEQILREREEKLKEIKKEDELKLEESEKEARYKFIGIVVFGFLFIILIVIFEIFNIRQMKKKE